MAIDTRGKRASAVSFIKPWIIPGVDNTSFNGPERFSAAWGYAGSAPVYSLVSASTVHAHAADASAFGQDHALAISESLHDHGVDSPSLGQIHALAINNALHGHLADVVSFGPDGVFPSDALHDHAAAASAFGQSQALAIAEAFHAHAADSVTLAISNHSLGIQNAHHDHGVDSPVLEPNLVPADALHGHTSDASVFGQDHTLAVNEALHAHSAEAAALTPDLTIADAIHAHIADSGAFGQDHAVVSADALHDHTVDNVTIGTDFTFVPDDCLHLVSSDSPALSQTQSLAIDDAIHDHGVDSPDFGQVSSLAADSSLHAHTADSVLVSDFLAGQDFMTLAGHIKAQIEAHLSSVTVARMRRVQTIEESDFVNILSPRFEHQEERLSSEQFDMRWVYPLECYSWGETRETALDNAGALVNSVTTAIYNNRRISNHVDIACVVSGGEADDTDVPAFYRGVELLLELETHEGA